MRYVEEDCGYKTPCWIWQLALDRNGYGVVRVAGKLLSAARCYYEERFGAIPPGRVLDHLCRVPACVRPDHTEPVTHAENVRRGLKGVLRTHCKRGHELTSENTYLYRRNRRCRACKRLEERERRDARKAA